MDPSIEGQLVGDSHADMHHMALPPEVIGEALDNMHIEPMANFQANACFMVDLNVCTLSDPIIRKILLRTFKSKKLCFGFVSRN